MEMSSWHYLKSGYQIGPDPLLPVLPQEIVLYVVRFALESKQKFFVT